MREIKFRAWDKESQEFIYYTDIEGLNHYCDAQFQKLNIKERQQYVCLKDKNGKDIYEGDILKIKPHGYEEKKLIVESIFSLNFCHNCYSGDLYSYSENFEVIGNIYEHPELLGGKNEIHKL